jgi:hypothetical protein
MSAFISHSFENKPAFESVTDALDIRGMAFWNPAEICPGASLREQLRAAVERCSLCIFIATRKSVDSSWCGAGGLLAGCGCASNHWVDRSELIEGGDTVTSQT